MNLGAATDRRARSSSTTALATLNVTMGRELGLARGANVVMPNVTPSRYRALYDIYPNKACVAETPRAYKARLRKRLHSMGRTAGRGRGDSPNYLRRQKISNRTTEWSTHTVSPVAGDGADIPPGNTANRMKCY